MQTKLGRDVNSLIKSIGSAEKPIPPKRTKKKYPKKDKKAIIAI